MALTLLSGRTSRLLSSVTGSWRQPHILGAPLNHARRGLECRHWSSSSKLLIPSLNEHELINHTTGGWLYNHDRRRLVSPSRQCAKLIKTFNRDLEPSVVLQRSCPDPRSYQVHRRNSLRQVRENGRG